MTDAELDQLVARLKRDVSEQWLDWTGKKTDVLSLLNALTAYRAKVAALEAEVKIAEAKGWRDAVSCVQYCEVHWYQDCRSAEERKALENAARELVNELVTCSPGEWLGTEWKTAQDYSDTIAKLEAEATRWREVAGELEGVLSDYFCDDDFGPSVARRISAALTRFRQESGQ